MKSDIFEIHFEKIDLNDQDTVGYESLLLGG